MIRIVYSSADRALLVAALFVLFSTCSRKNSDDPSPSKTNKPDNTFLTVKMNRGWLQEDAFWIFATDKAGKVIDAKQNVDSLVYLQSDNPVEDSVTLTYFIHAASGQKILQTVGLVPKNSTYEKTFFIESSIDTIGFADVTITGYQENFYSGMYLSDEYSGMPIWSISGGDYSQHFRLLKDQPDLLVSCFRDGAPVYALFQDVKNNDVLTEAFSELTPYPHTIALDFPSVYASLYGFRSHGNDGGYSGFPLGFINILSRDGINFTPGLGYIDGFDSYLIQAQRDLYVDENKKIVSSYGKRGTPSTAVTLPDYNYELVDSSFEKFEFTFAYPAAARAVSFKSADNVTWSIQTRTNAFPRIVEIPQQITSQFPEVNIANLKFDSFGATLVSSGSLDGETVEANGFSYFVKH